MDLFDLRNEYTSRTFDESDALRSPFELFEKWFHEAQESKIFEPNAMALATVNAHGIPSVRMILLKSFNADGFMFFSNYESRKGYQLIDNPNAASVFYWEELERQVRIEGIVEKLSSKESDKYFETRPTGSRLGAWASPQSRVVESRQWLEKKHNEFREKFKHSEVPRPANWGGYRLKPTLVEFWQGRAHRLHDRLQYRRSGKKWILERLAP